MTFKELYETVFEDIDESIGDAELLGKIKNFINRGYKELAKRELLEKEITKTVEAEYFSMPFDCFKISDIKQDGVHIEYATSGRKVYVVADTPITISYYYLPEKMEYDEDETVTNAANDEFIINYAKWLYYLNEGFGEEARYFKNELEGMSLVRNLIKITKTIDIYGVGTYV